MDKGIPYALVELAYKNKELDKLFLGIKPYSYIPKFSGAPGNIDLGSVIPQGIFPFISKNNSFENITYLDRTLNHLSKQYNGLFPVASFLTCSVLHKKNHGKLPIEIDNNQLAKNLKKTINSYQDQLKHDFTDIGCGEKKGKYEYFKNLSVVVQAIGGPNFFPEETKQEEGIKI